jgi:hypothetical protein
MKESVCDYKQNMYVGNVNNPILAMNCFKIDFFKMYQNWILGALNQAYKQYTLNTTAFIICLSHGQL